ncbi:hypothetical protein Bhyg_10636 [Pseudolycoriella hygida]|uniref:Uncharacterized protein n=1 Tax=Pseudolycoriella hygida TaxID=35572 RepID=A0A9Q0RXK2_9DIPT|nr:hypothetical protein Bhyg_10636 [Pseudolycoriella hygida]
MNHGKFAHFVRQKKRSELGRNKFKFGELIDLTLDH